MPDYEHKVAPKELAKVRIMWRERDIVGSAPEAAVSDEDKSEESSDGENSPAAPDDEGASEESNKSVDRTDEDSAVDDESVNENGLDGDEESTDDKDSESDEDDDFEKLNLAEDPNEMPEVDLQLETALLLMRLHLLGESDFRVAAIESKASDQDVRNP